MNIQTKRLVLLPVEKKHKHDIFANFSNEVTTYMFPCPANKISETESVIENFTKQRIDGTDFVYVITLSDTSEFLGTCGLHKLKGEIPELGIWTKISAHGNYYGREAIGGLIEYAENMGIKKLLYPVDKRNIASKKIPLYFGGVLSSEKEVITPDGRKLYLEEYMIDTKCGEKSE
ncbi:MULTISPECIES: GNAT family N-acetyltransferase [unclassified Clostridioides]|uniref:GNAT family N-acetyltransferase n=1 Tax=unclassified Clostridioides TaxID=2635829 RepID=UPI001D103A72|nr:GNAT family N-acetyltransferase [Clostridioides sp. ES-S-0049-03]MCC0677773.1 GNAT family N-acetyltransferase [Clostridioides sp. ES-W-0018-02]MCC0713116.1 GNAT family N-acetyltransferase [Clostridioides sp. ES-W-0017-02]